MTQMPSEQGITNRSKPSNGPAAGSGSFSQNRLKVAVPQRFLRMKYVETQGH
jgi:hypothetical protein